MGKPRSSLLQRTALAALAVVVACGGGMPPVVRAETSAVFDVAANIVPGCLVDGLGASGEAGHIGSLDFGTDSTFSRATRAASTSASQVIRLRCTPGVSVMMTIDGGDHAEAGARHLQLGADTGARIAYNLCSDAACTQSIAIGGNAAITASAANSEDIRLPIFATLVLPGALPPGTYRDTLTVTLTW